MRKYAKMKNASLEELCCNQCGKKLLVEQGVIREGSFHAEAVFGYFSRKDGVRHNWDLCEDCYDRLVKSFVIPPQEEEAVELL